MHFPPSWFFLAVKLAFLAIVTRRLWLFATERSGVDPKSGKFHDALRDLSPVLFWVFLALHVAIFATVLGLIAEDVIDGVHMPKGISIGL